MWIERYQAGNEVEVWRELRSVWAHGSAQERAEIRLIVAELMRRVAYNVERLSANLQQIGWRFAHNSEVRTVVDGQEQRNIEQVEQQIGALPEALKSCLTIVGGANLCGTHPQWTVPTYLFDENAEAVLADPLVLPTSDWLLYNFAEWQQDNEDSDEPEAEFPFEFAPDEEHKANYSGDSHIVLLPDTSLDPILYGISNRPSITLVEYLRVSFKWGGFPGFEFVEPSCIPPAIEALRHGLMPF